jgi:hypothetical protein
MKNSRRSRPTIEVLEARDCPSLTIQSISGNLLISGAPTGTTGLTIMGTGGKYQITDGTVNKGTFSASNITVNLTHFNEPITLDLGTQTLGGNVLMNLGTGNAVPGLHDVSIDDGTVGGSVTVTGGSPNDFLELGQPGGTLPLHVGGNVTDSANKGSKGQFFLYDTSSIGGSLSTTGVPSVQIGEIAGTGATIGGAVSVNAQTAGSPLSLTINGTSMLKKGLTVVGTPLNTGDGDFVDVAGGAAGATIQGNVSVNLGDGFNAWLMGGTYAGNVTLTGGNGVSPAAGTAENTVQLDDGTGTGPGIFQGSLQVTTGGGSTALIFNATDTVAGNMSLNFGNGTNDLGGGTLGGVFQGTVAGNLNITLGNGSNTALIETAPGGTLNWHSGNGSDTLTLGSALTPASSFWLVNLNFGTGVNMLTLAHTGNPPQFLSGDIEGDGTDTFTQDPDWMLISPLTFNF